jgi:glyoxylase-like metal-dependent hydrolase (beta-lactamase superfamily II)
LVKRPRKRKSNAAKRPKSPELAAQPESGSGGPVFTIRHYCQGIGDCHLLTFTRQDGALYRILIDCGVHSSITGGSDLVREIAADIKAETGGKIDVLVITHEHWDHVSGFLRAAETFNDFSIGEVWMPWTEDPDDPDAIALDKFRAQALSALQGASRRLDDVKGASPHIAGLRDGLQSILGFSFGAKGERVRAARDAAASLSTRQPPLYFGPETPPFPLPGLPNLRVYVLGPPRDKASLRLEEKESEMYALSGNKPNLSVLNAGLAANAPGIGIGVEIGPFDASLGNDLAAVLAGSVDDDISKFVRLRYSGPLPSESEKVRIDDATARDQSWRRIDADWLGVASDLAIQLDRGINNSSLVLAFEEIDTRRVYLFPGDAQIGSWLSWKDVSWTFDGEPIEATDLLARTVFLKVSHHGSRNATPEKRGLDLMTNSDLSAFIPTNEDDARKVRWHEMPYDGIMTALTAKTGGRVIRADDSWLGDADGKPGFAVPSGSILAVKNAIRGRGRHKSGFWVELDLA